MAMGDPITPKDGGPAFPMSTNDGYSQDGMTLRDWFAGKALPSAVEDYGEPSLSTSSGQRRDRGNPVLPYANKVGGTREDIIARQAYAYADAMLAARERQS